MRRHWNRLSWSWSPQALNAHQQHDSYLHTSKHASYVHTPANFDYTMDSDPWADSDAFDHQYRTADGPHSQPTSPTFARQQPQHVPTPVKSPVTSPSALGASEAISSLVSSPPESKPLQPLSKPRPTSIATPPPDHQLDPWSTPPTPPPAQGTGSVAVATVEHVGESTDTPPAAEVRATETEIETADITQSETAAGTSSTAPGAQGTSSPVVLGGAQVEDPSTSSAAADLDTQDLTEATAATTLSDADESDPYATPAPFLTSGGDDTFDDFDDFDEPSSGFGGPAAVAGLDEGGFGDAAFASGDGFDDDGFGDFGEFEEGAGFDAEPEPQAAAPLPVVPAVTWSALELRPVPPRSELLDRIKTVLEPFTPDYSAFTDEPPRAVGGLAQVLVSESSRDAYAQMTTPPILKPLDWTRSRVRRDHLISMGVPVNLDEVDSHRLSTLPPLRITTQGLPPLRAGSASAPGGTARNSTDHMGGAKSRSAGRSPTSPNRATRGPPLTDEERKFGLQSKPSLDMPAAEALCALSDDELRLMPLSKLRTIQADIARSSADASALLAWYLQLKDGQMQEAATCNGMISELIANAAKVKGASSGGSLFRRNSSRPNSVQFSGTASPRRVNSPGIF